MCVCDHQVWPWFDIEWSFTIARGIHAWCTTTNAWLHAPLPASIVFTKEAVNSKITSAACGEVDKHPILTEDLCMAAADAMALSRWIVYSTYYQSFAIPNIVSLLTAASLRDRGGVVSSATRTPGCFYTKKNGVSFNKNLASSATAATEYLVCQSTLGV